MAATIPIGPYHVALKEPIFLKLEVEGERIKDADIKLGYHHRGIEYLAMRRTYWQNIFLFERVCGICSDAHTTCYCQTVEDVAGVTPPERALFLRVLVAELERIHSHLLWLGVAMHIIGFDTLFMQIWRDREYVQDLLEIITGNRVNYAYNTIGGVRRDVDEKTIRLVKKYMDTIKNAFDKTVEAILQDPVIEARVKGVGVLTHEEAKRYGVVGPTARASRIASDIRKDDPYAAYDRLDWEMIVFDEGDVLAKTLVRVYEVYESIKMVNESLEKLPPGPIVTEVSRFPPGEAFGRVEAPRGELVYYIKSNGTNVPERVKVRTPSFMNIASVKPMLLEETIADAPLIFASVDPCVACTERVIIVDSRTNEKKIMTFNEFMIRYGRKRK